MSEGSKRPIVIVAACALLDAKGAVVNTYSNAAPAPGAGGGRGGRGGRGGGGGAFSALGGIVRGLGAGSQHAGGAEDEQET